jgi:predicted tellurium resistance membrane protein TerC
MGLTQDLFSLPRFWTADPSDRHGVSGRDLTLVVGGLFLIGKATYEIHEKLEGRANEAAAPVVSSLAAGILQLVLIDIVFPLDPIITAVGMIQTRPEGRWIGLTIMITAVVSSVLVMMMFAGAISTFIERHPTMKILALFTYGDRTLVVPYRHAP